MRNDRGHGERPGRHEELYHGRRRRSRAAATNANAPPTSTVKYSPQPASSTCGQSGFQLTERSIRPKPGSTSQLRANAAASARRMAPSCARVADDLGR